MQRTPALSAAAAALGLMAGLALEASTGAPGPEPRAYTVEISWSQAADRVPVALDGSSASARDHAEHAVLSGERCKRKADDEVHPEFRRS